MYVPPHNKMVTPGVALEPCSCEARAIITTLLDLTLSDKNASYKSQLLCLKSSFMVHPINALSFRACMLLLSLKVIFSRVIFTVILQALEE